MDAISRSGPVVFADGDGDGPRKGEGEGERESKSTARESEYDDWAGMGVAEAE
jgi:hypothetical protein